MKIEIFAICWNEEKLLPYFHKFYKDRFGEHVKFTIYDNESTDNSVKICNELGMNVISYSTNNQLSDSKYLDIKNNCWKGSTADWVICQDVDEWLDISYNELLEEYEKGTTLINTIGYNMCNKEGVPNFLDIKYGIRAAQYDKILCFSPKYITNISYSPGCHNCSPVGKIKYSQKAYNMLHMKFIDEQFMVDRYKAYKERMSAENLRNNWGIQYKSEEETIRRDYKNHINASVKIIE